MAVPREVCAALDHMLNSFLKELHAKLMQNSFNWGVCVCVFFVFVFFKGGLYGGSPPTFPGQQPVSRPESLRIA